MADITIGRSYGGREWRQRFADSGDGTHAEVVVQAMASASADLLAVPAADTDAVITLAAAAGVRHYVPRVVWSYSADPTDGELSVEVDGDVVLEVDITAGGAGFLPLGIVSSEGGSVVVTLAAGGSGVTGKVSLPGARSD